MSRPPPPENRPSSPACLAHEGDDTYMGYASAEEITRFRQELAEKLQTMLPRVRDDALFARLQEALRCLAPDQSPDS